MVAIIQFGLASAQALDDIGLSFSAVSDILLGPPGTVGTASIREDSPSWARSFIAREHRACESIFISLTSGGSACRHPVSGEPVDFEYSFVPKVVLTMTVPIFRVFGRGHERFCIVYAGLTSRVTHIIVPKIDCIVYDLDRSSSALVWDAFNNAEPAVASGTERRPKIGIVDMVTSYAHQAMNHLSGIQRLIDGGLCDSLDEIWVFGLEFFGRTADIFPEAAVRIRHLNRQDCLEILASCELDLFKIGSNFLSKSLHDRILALPTTVSPPNLRSLGRWPLLAVTIRSADRRCLNLGDVVERIVSTLLKSFPDLGVILDGWVFPETSIIARSNMVTALSDFRLERLRDESALCRSIATRLPAGVLVYNLFGLSLLESMHALRDADCYFAHVGTLQHKIAWFTQSRGLVHGPRAELTRMESSYYACEMGTSPAFVDADHVEDVPASARGPQKYDYNICNVNGIAEVLCTLIECSAAGTG